jgi:rhamnogalacturonyl hydrolase YesR
MIRPVWLAALAVTVSASASAIPPARSQSPLAAAERVADWQLARLAGAGGITRSAGETADSRSWIRGAFWIGLTELADREPANNRFTAALMAMGRANRWRPGDRPYHADDQAISQAYLWAARRGAGSAAVGPTRAKLDAILARPPRVGLAFYDGAGYEKAECLDRWCWCDALFMAPPTWIELSRQTGDPRYARFALKETWATVDFLYDPAERLFYRDSRFFERRDAEGHKLFWARGNGWVFAGFARMIPMLPKGSPDRLRMEGLFREMAERLVALQKPDGYWAPSLLAASGSPPESSGTGFFTYGLAWGVKSGLLERRRYEPAVRRGWDALLRSVQPDGRLGWVQQVSDRPEQVAATDTQYYGVGAFLLAAAAVSDLDRRH